MVSMEVSKTLGPGSSPGTPARVILWEINTVSESAVPIEGKHKEGIGEFIKKTRGELDKTSFPSSDDVKNTTIIVIISVMFFAAYLFLVDRAWVYILEALTWVINKIAGV
jgi:preprotein translocase subunit SecE